MTAATALVAFIILVALTFDFLNGFHDAANSIATAASMRSRVRCETRPGLLIARDTVEGDTSTIFATSSSVGCCLREDGILLGARFFLM